MEKCCVQQTGEAAHTDLQSLAVVLFRFIIVSKKWIIQVAGTVSQRKQFLECFTLQNQIFGRATQWTSLFAICLMLTYISSKDP